MFNLTIAVPKLLSCCNEFENENIIQITLLLPCDCTSDVITGSY